MSDIRDTLCFFLAAEEPSSTTIGAGVQAVIGELLKHSPPLIYIRHDQYEARYVLTEAGEAMRAEIGA